MSESLKDGITVFAASFAKEFSLFLEIATGAEEDAIAYLNAVELVATLGDDGKGMLGFSSHCARFSKSFAFDPAPENKVSFKGFFADEEGALPFEVKPDNLVPDLEPENL